MMGMWHGLREKLRGARGLEWLLLLVAACVAALALFQGSSGDGTVQSTELEARLERVLSAVEGAGDVRAMVTEREEKIVGVVIVAEGAGDIGVRLSLMQAARALLEIDLEQIEVIEMRREGNARSMVVDGLYFCPAGGGDGAGVLKAPGAAAERAGGGLRFL